jgi:hypothetical protein
MHGLAALCHKARKGGYIGSRSTYTWRASSLLDKTRGNCACQLRVRFFASPLVLIRGQCFPAPPKAKGSVGIPPPNSRRTPFRAS